MRSILGEPDVADPIEAHPALECGEDALYLRRIGAINALWRFWEARNDGPPPQLLCIMRSLIRSERSHARRAFLA